MEKVIGIDLGTTNSVVAVLEAGKPTIIQNMEGNRITPSVVAFSGNNKELVGESAKRQAIINSQNTIFSIKRFMGIMFDEVAADIRRVPYEVVKRELGDVAVEVKERLYTPPEVSARILQKLKETAEDYLGHEVKQAVITVPAYFNDRQRQATKDAGRIAGLEVLRIINEPTASALAYGLDKQKKERIAIYDFGGGTFDISILELAGEVFEVKATNGDTHLGGDDIDWRLVNWLADEFYVEEGVNLREDITALQRLREAAEKAKCELDFKPQTVINLPFITNDTPSSSGQASGAKHLNITLSRMQFEQLAGDIIEKTVEPCKQALKDASLDPMDLDGVVLVGGSTRTPLVQETVRRVFGMEPYTGVNPDEVVAAGAAIQAGVLSGEINDVLLLDVISLSLGIETLGGLFHRLIRRNTTIPARRGEIFSTAEDDQSAVSIVVLQGEREMAVDNRALGKFNLVDIPLAPRGMPRIEVTFDVDVNGILHVSALDLVTENEQKIEVTPSSGLTEEEIEQIIQDAKTHVAEDEKRREEIKARNDAETTINVSEKKLKEYSDKIDENENKKILRAIAEVKNTLDCSRSRQDFGPGRVTTETSLVEAIRKATDNLTQACYKLAEFDRQKSWQHKHG